MFLCIAYGVSSGLGPLRSKPQKFRGLEAYCLQSCFSKMEFLQKSMNEGRSHSKKKVLNFTLGGGGESGQKWFIFTLFFIFFLLCPKSCKSAWEGGYPLTWKSNFLDILGKNLVIFYNYSRFISEKINYCYQNMFQLMFEKKNFLKFHTF